MRLPHIATAAAFVATLALASTSAFAFQRGGESHHSAPSHAAQHAQPRAMAPAPRAAAPRVAPQQRGVVTAQRVAPRVNGGVVVGRAVPRPYAPAYGGHYAPYYGYGSHYYGYGHPAYYRPYTFYPHFSIGFGFYAGYPVPYSYWAYPAPVTVYGYAAPPAPVVVGPNNTAYGGMTFEMTPPDAEVYVDGNYAGHVGDFDGTRQPMTVTPGTHTIQISAPGYQSLTFDVQVQAGQVIPYRGDLQR